MKLKIPPIADRPDPEVELRGVYLEEWIEELPYAEPVHMLETVLDALDRFNRSPVKAAQRFALLEQYVRPYQFLLEVQEGYHTINTVASVERHRAQADAARRMALAMADGYKIVLSQTLGKRSLFGEAREARPALQRASLFLSFALLHCYDEYLPTPPLVWRELGALYVYAVRKGLADRPGPRAGNRPEFDQDIATMFKRLALTSVVDPYHLAYGDVWRVYQHLHGSAGDARATSPAEASGGAGHFVVDPRSDSRPEPLASAEHGPDRHCVVLDARPTIEALRARRTALARKTPRGEEALLLDTMIRALGEPPARRGDRERSEGRVRLVAGLGAVHHFLSGAAPPRAPGSADEAEAEEIEVGGLGGPEAGSAGRPRYAPEFWELRNEGEGGFGVLRRVRPTQAVGVGEIIGLQFPMRGQAGADWSVGVVRWLTVDDAGACNAGVQLLGERAEPGRVGEAGRELPVLMIAPATNASPPILIAAHGVYADRRLVTVEATRGATALRAVELLETASGFERIAVQSA